MSGPDSTWMGRLSATASRSQSAVRMQQEKSFARFSTPDRPVRRSVLPILEEIPSNRLARMASCAPSSCFALIVRS